METSQKINNLVLSNKGLKFHLVDYSNKKSIDLLLKFPSQDVQRHEVYASDNNGKTHENQRLVGWFDYPGVSNKTIDFYVKFYKVAETYAKKYAGDNELDLKDTTSYDNFIHH